ncbi:hypothetical protein GOBAR_AA20379 [Gossypium barbadense]|uniref:Uncharacterized protein n=1 Tax=Gossypium barbadense TaxID=3634 RepID=A0A2P5XAC2_GOSBA|nr:hypothetical protein GOBAR_AA20379 [Gossypium barbadense]
MPSNTETNPREQLHAITMRDEEGLVESRFETRLKAVVSNGKDEMNHGTQEPLSELILRVGDDTIKLQACDSTKISSNQDDCLNSVNSRNIMAQTSFRETPRKNVMELHSNPSHKNRATHEERRLQIDKLDEWRTHVKEKPKAHDESKQHHDERKNETKQFKVGDKVLLDEKDPRIATSELNANRVTPFMVLYIMTNPKGKKVAIPSSKKQKETTFSSSSTTEIRHPFLQLPPGPQEELFQILRARPLGVGRCIDWAVLETVHLADLLDSLITDSDGGIRRPRNSSIPPWRSMAQSSTLTLNGQISPQGIQSMFYMRMIEHHHGFDPPQYRLAQATDEDDAEDIPDDIPAF